MGESQIPDFDRGSSGQRGSGAPHVDSCADATGHLRPPSDGSAAGNASKESHSDGRITVERVARRAPGSSDVIPSRGRRPTALRASRGASAEAVAVVGHDKIRDQRTRASAPDHRRRVRPHRRRPAHARPGSLVRRRDAHCAASRPGSRFDCFSDSARDPFPRPLGDPHDEGDPYTEADADPDADPDDGDRNAVHDHGVRQRPKRHRNCHAA